MRISKKKTLLVASSAALLVLVTGTALTVARFKDWFHGRDKIVLEIAYNPDYMDAGSLAKLQKDFQAEHSEISFVNHITVHSSDREVSDQDRAADVFLTNADQGSVLLENDLLLKDFAAEAFQDFHPKALEMATRKDTLIGVPLYFSHYLVMFANNRMLKSIPEDFATLEQATRDLHDPRAGRYAVSAGYEAYLALPFLGAHGYYGKQKEPSAAQEAAEAAFGELNKLHREKGLVPASCDSRCALNLFTKGQSPLLMAGEWQLAPLLQSMAADLAVGALPKMDAAGQTMGTPINGLIYYFNRNIQQDHREAAEQWLAFLTSPSTQASYWTAMHKVPSRVNQVLQSDLPGKQLLRGLVAAVDHSFCLEQFQSTESVLLALEVPLDALYRGRLTPSQAAVRLLSEKN